MMKRKYLIFASCLTGMLILFAMMIGLNIAQAAPTMHEPPDPEATPEVNAESNTIENPTYYEHIEPIIQANCAACHTEGGIGYAFMDVEDIELITDLESAEYISFLTSTGYMPPWPPSDESLPMAHERKLTNVEIAMIDAWVRNGAPLGDPANRPTYAEPTNIPQIRHDLVLTMEEPYTPSGELLDDYRCFLFDPGFEEDTLITGTDFIPGNAEIAHHSLFFIIDETLVEEAQAKSDVDGRPGWECFGGTGLEGASRQGLANVDQQQLITALQAQDVNIVALVTALQDFQNVNGAIGELDFVEFQTVLEENGVDMRQLFLDLDVDVASMSGSGMSGSVGGWVPGAVPLKSPENTGILVPANSQIVVQMHYNLYATTGSDQSSLILETAPFTEAMTPLNPRALVAPVEIPCPEGVAAPDCDREVSRMDTVNPNTGNALLAACGQTLATYAENTADNAYGYCDYPIPFEGWLLGVGPHMHELGAATRIILNPDTPDETILIDIPDWDFHWQGQYSFAQPVELQPGDTIRLECWWDNSEGERYVTWGEGTQDEMCFNFTRFLRREAGKTLADYGFMADEHTDSH